MSIPFIHRNNSAENTNILSPNHMINANDSTRHRNVLKRWRHKVCSGQCNTKGDKSWKSILQNS